MAAVSVTPAAGDSAAAAARRIFNHDIMGCTAEGVTGNHLYSGRALGATEPGDVIQLHPELRSEWPSIRAHYARIGLDHCNEVVWDTSHGVLAEHREHAVSVFFFGDGEQRVRPDRRWFGVVEHINCKNRFMQAAEALGVPVPVTRRFARVEDITPADVDQAPYPCYLKAAVSVSGVGIYRCADKAALTAAMQRYPAGTPVQIQEEVATDVFLNLQYEVEGETLRRYAATEQVLDGCVHQGNRFPARCEPWDCVEPMARWLHAEGMRGVFAFDVAVLEHAGETRHLAIECNPRFNGASYPTAVAKKLGLTRWLAQVFKTRHRRLADLDLGGLELDPATGEGVVLINWGPIKVGKFLALIAGDEQRQQAIADELRARL
jgi:hypothetical protein